MPPLQIHYRLINLLIPYARNAKQHSDAHVAQIAASPSLAGAHQSWLTDKTT